MQDIWHGLTTSDFEALAEAYGTPFYLYDADAVAARIERVRNAFNGVVDVYFAAKANPNLALLKAIKPVADGIDISSDGELEQVARAQYDMATLSFAGPAKSLPELENAVRRGVGSISVESRREICDLARAARALGTRANIALRINPLLKIKEYGIKMGGRPVQFGIDEEDIPAVVPLIRENADALTFKGVHVYIGSQCFDLTGIEASVRDTLRLARLVAEGHGLAIGTVNFGGGFGVAQDDRGRELDVDAVGAALTKELWAFREDEMPGCRLIFELGRFLAAEAGIYVTRVVGTKASRGTAFCVADGGLSHHLAAAGTFGVGIRRNFPLRNLSRPDGLAVRCHIAGPSCNPTDLLGVDACLAKPQAGDLLGVLSSGSYGYTASPLLFLGRPTPAELVRTCGEIVLGRPSRTILDFN